ncbi:MAG: tRNA pseudouridine(55) synthase TruB [Lachnospiraceae bacterium]
MNGVMNVYKEKGFTSHDVVAKLRGILHMKKIGHTGTLDPDAEGVLPVCLGSGTKLCDMLTDKSKTYRAVLLLGAETDTQDISGKILSESPVICGEEEVQAAIESFVGEYEQIPPMYSALKVNGKKLYELAREGKVIERKARKVEISNIIIEKIELPYVTMSVSCSKGTYIRTLCHDIGAKLGCGGCMAQLIRTRVGVFYLEDAKTLKEIEEFRNNNQLDELVTPVWEMFPEYERCVVKEEFIRLSDNGNPLPVHALVNEPENPSPILVFEPSGRFVGIYQWDEVRNKFWPQKMFLES